MFSGYQISSPTSKIRERYSVKLKYADGMGFVGVCDSCECCNEDGDYVSVRVGE